MLHRQLPAYINRGRFSRAYSCKTNAVWFQRLSFVMTLTPVQLDTLYISALVSRTICLSPFLLEREVFTYEPFNLCLCNGRVLDTAAVIKAVHLLGTA